MCGCVGKEGEKVPTYLHRVSPLPRRYRRSKFHNPRGDEPLDDEMINFKRAPPSLLINNSVLKKARLVFCPRMVLNLQECVA